jgi:hypothetical protein
LVKTTGDGILATFDGPGRAIHCACAIRVTVRSLELVIRAGVHTGEVEIIGDDVGGIAVHIGARVMSNAGPGEVLVSSSVPPWSLGQASSSQTEANIDEGRGAVDDQLKGVLGAWKLFAVTG